MKGTGVFVNDREVREGDSVWGVQSDYYRDRPPGQRDRNAAGIVFWSEYWNDWRILEGSFAEFYAGERAGYPLSNMTSLILYPQESAKEVT